jgi:hypothetical protein
MAKDINPTKKSGQRKHIQARMRAAAERMEKEYPTDPELTVFISIDGDDFLRG